MILADRPETTNVPLSPPARWIELFYWLFLFSFAFDYRAPAEGSSISTILQMGFLALCMSSTGAIIILGRQTLLVRPMAWLIAGWALFLLVLFINAIILQGVPFSRFIRVVLPFLLCLLGILNAHTAACTGIRLSRLAAPIFLVAIINVTWRMIHGFVFAGVDIESVRIEILSPALTWLAVFIAASILLRGKLHWTLFLAGGLFLAALVLSVTRGLLFPIFASTMGAVLAFFHGMRWRVYQLEDLKRLALPIAAAGILGVLGIGVAAVAVPSVLERWHERLFTPTTDRNMVADPSILSRQAEIEGFIEILNNQPIHYLHGMGVGASYYWHPKYLPQLYLIYPEGVLDDTGEVWFAGHSIWTYALFSGGIIGVLAFLCLFAFAFLVSFRAAVANAANPGPDHWILYFSMITVLAIVSQSLTSNPFDERLLGLLFGATVGMTQAGFIRACWIHPRSATTSKPPSA